MQPKYLYYWSMTPAGFVSGRARVWGEYGALSNDVVGLNGAVRPVINVTTDNGFTSGDGSTSTSYVITTE